MKNLYTKKSLLLLFCAFICLGLSKPGFLSKKPDDERRVAIRTMAEETLAELYRIKPEAESVVQNAAGYAVFGNFGMKIFVAGGGRGKGIAVNNRTGAETFMKMLEIQAGIGMGVKKFKLVWVFDDEGSLDRFMNSGWELGAQATAQASLNEKGGGYAGAMSVSRGVWLYQITDDGLALELTAKGTKYYQDKDLNDSDS